MRVTKQQASAGFFLGFGSLAYWLASGLEMGTAADMGVGYTPRMLAAGCLIVGGLLLLTAVVSGGDEEAVTISPAPMVLVTVMVAGFALLLPWLGLPLAVIASVLPAAVSGETFRWPALLAIATALAALTTGLFAFGLRLQLPVWPVFLPPLSGL